LYSLVVISALAEVYSMARLSPRAKLFACPCHALAQTHLRNALNAEN
jgi:hypothetical protein